MQAALDLPQTVLPDPAKSVIADNIGFLLSGPGAWILYK
jgi:hypothetical protein